MNTTPCKKILFACYGGGHVQTLLPVILEAQKKKEYTVEVIGFTTAKKTLLLHGIHASGYEVFLHDELAVYEELARKLMPSTLHVDVTEEESIAYHAIGMSDLIQEYGKEKAMQKFTTEGRGCFLPTKTLARYLKISKPDLIVTTASPRSERALLIAGEQLDITTLCISDLFLQHESRYICNQEYSKNVCVMSGFTKTLLESSGYHGTIFVTGNPAFDELLNIDPCEGKDLRAKLNIPQNNKVIMWVCPSATHSLAGKKFMCPDSVLQCLESIVQEHDDVSVLVREHPSNSVVNHTRLNKVIVCPPEHTIEECLSAADVVLLETSTVGLQAALLGIPVVTMNAEDYPPYAQLGLSIDVKDVKDIPRALLHPIPPDQSKLAYPKLGTATKNVIRVIDSLLDQKDSL